MIDAYALYYIHEVLHQVQIDSMLIRRDIIYSGEGIM
jgi:hypothetical protein